MSEQQAVQRQPQAAPSFRVKITSRSGTRRYIRHGGSAIGHLLDAMEATGVDDRIHVMRIDQQPAEVLR